MFWCIEEMMQFNAFLSRCDYETGSVDF